MHWRVNSRLTHTHAQVHLNGRKRKAEEKKPRVIWLLSEGLMADECWQHAGKDRQLPSAPQSAGSQAEIHKYKVIQFKSILLTENTILL